MKTKIQSNVANTEINIKRERERNEEARLRDRQLLAHAPKCDAITSAVDWQNGKRHDSPFASLSSNFLKGLKKQ